MLSFVLGLVALNWQCDGRRMQMIERSPDTSRLERLDSPSGLGELLFAFSGPSARSRHSRHGVVQNPRLDPHVARLSTPRLQAVDAEEMPSDVNDEEELPSDVNDEEELPSDVNDLTIDVIEETPRESPTTDADVNARKRSLLALGAATSRGEAATADEKFDAEMAIEFLEQSRPVSEISDKCLGTWELVMSNTQLFRSSPFFMAGRAVCQDGVEADRYNYFCDLHRAALAVSTIQRVRQVVSPLQIVSEFEVLAGAVPFVGEYFNIKYSGGLPFDIQGAIVSTADIVRTEGAAWRLLMDTVEVKGSNIPGLRQALDSGIKLESRALGNFLEENIAGYTNPEPKFRVTYVDDDLRISRDQDDNWFVYIRSSDSQIPKDYSDSAADLGVGKFLDGLQRTVLAR